MQFTHANKVLNFFPLYISCKCLTAYFAQQLWTTSCPQIQISVVKQNVAALIAKIKKIRWKLYIGDKKRIFLESEMSLKTTQLFIYYSSCRQIFILLLLFFHAIFLYKGWRCVHARPCCWLSSWLLLIHTSQWDTNTAAGIKTSKDGLQLSLKWEMQSDVVVKLKDKLSPP